MTEQEITKQIGSPIEIDFRKPKAIGSTGFYLKSFKTRNLGVENLKLGSKCNFEKRTDGILLRANYSNKLTVIPISRESIIVITMIRGKEKIDPHFLSPMWILLKLGVSKLYARYFGWWKLREYSIDPMELNLKTTEYEMKLMVNGYLFERQLSFFESLNYKNKLKTIIKSST